MTKRERVLASVRRKPIDAIPWQFDLIEATKEKLVVYFGSDDWFELIDDHVVRLSSKEIPSSSDLPAHLRRDELGSVWRRAPRDHKVGNWGELVDYPLKEPSFGDYRFPDPNTVKDRWAHIARLRERYPDHYLEAGGIGLYQRAWSLCGFENYLSYIAGEPKFVEELTDKLCEFSREATRQLKGTECDGIRFGDDWGFQDSLMIDPGTWRRIYKKYYRRIYGAARDAGLVVAIHSCGNITELLPDLIDIGVEVVHPLQPEAMDVEYCKREYGKHLAFWGALGSQSVLPKGTPEDVRKEAKYLVELFQDGGFILAPSGAPPAETPAANIVAMAEVGRSQLG